MALYCTAINTAGFNLVTVTHVLQPKMVICKAQCHVSIRVQAIVEGQMVEDVQYDKRSS